MNLAVRGEMGPAGGWFARVRSASSIGKRVTVSSAATCSCPSCSSGKDGRPRRRQRRSRGVAEIGERFGERDLVALALQIQGMVRINQAGWTTA